MKRGCRRICSTMFAVGLLLAGAWSPIAKSTAVAAGRVQGGAGAPLTLSKVYGGAELTLQHSGMIYTATIRSTSHGAGQTSRWVDRMWVDPGGNVGRTETRVQTPRGRTTEYRIDTPWGSYIRYPQDSKVTPASLNTCYGTGIAVSVVLGCPGPTETSTTQIRLGRYGGKPAIVLLKSGTAYAEDSSSTFVSRLYLDPDTFLPIAMTASGKTDSGRVVTYRGQSDYTHRFVPRSSLPANLFDPASIGYRPPENDLNHPPAGFTVYWLGAHVARTGGYPALSLYQVETASGGGPGYFYILYYGRPPIPVASSTVSLQEYPASRNGFLRSPNGPCRKGKTVTLTGGTGTVFRAGSGYGACADFRGTTVFLIGMGDSGSAPAGRAYDSLRGMEALVRSLQPRRPRS